MRLKNSFIMIVFLLAAQFGAAQEEYVIYEGTQLNYSVENTNGNSYTWEVANAAPDSYVLTNTTPAGVGILWNIAGEYQLKVTESHPTGCSTTRQLQVSVQPNNREAEFGIMASSECFNKENNSFSLAFNLLDNNGVALAKAYFPMKMEFTVNGTAHEKTVAFGEQTLLIKEEWFAVNPTQNTEVIVEITSVTDAKNVAIPGLAKATHTRTIFELPTIEFTEELRRRYKLNEEIIAYVRGDDDSILRTE